MLGQCNGHIHVLAEHGQTLGIRHARLLQLGELAPPLRGKLEQDPPETTNDLLEVLGGRFEQRRASTCSPALRSSATARGRRAGRHVRQPRAALPLCGRRRRAAARDTPRPN